MSDWLHPMTYVVVLWRYTPFWLALLAQLALGLLLGYAAGRLVPMLSTGRF